MLRSERVRELLDYDPDTGVFVWARDYSSRRKGAVAGHVSATNGAVEIRIDRRPYLAHRLAWLLIYGVWPKLFIDHANGDPSDNRIANLRQATVSQNAANKRRPATNSSGYKGVCWNKSSKKWQAGIKVNGRSFHLGLFATPEDAHEAYLTAAVHHFGEFARAA